MRDSAIEKIEVKLTQSKKKKKKIRLKTGSLEDAAAMSCPAKVNHLCAIVKHVRRQSRVFDAPTANHTESTCKVCRQKKSEIRFLLI